MINLMKEYKEYCNAEVANIKNHKRAAVLGLLTGLAYAYMRDEDFRKG